MEAVKINSALLNVCGELPLHPRCEPGFVQLTTYQGDLAVGRNSLGRAPACIVRAGHTPPFPMPVFVPKST
jgi:hypothetical protein